MEAVFRLYDECRALEDEIFLPHEQGQAGGAPGNVATIVSTGAQTGGPPGTMTVSIGGHLITGNAEEISAQMAALLPSTTAEAGEITTAEIPGVGMAAVVPPPPSAPSSSSRNVSPGTRLLEGI